MRRVRSRRSHLYVVSAILLAYSALSAYSETKFEGNADTDIDTDLTTGSEGLQTPNALPTPPEGQATDTIHEGSAIPSTVSAAEWSSSASTVTTESTSTSHPTWRPKRVNCTPPAIEQFPRPLMGPHARKHGGLVIHVIVAIFTFLGLAIVCDDYFVSSLDRICEELKLSPDVAGATFMAAGSSAPELATVVIGVFFAKDDIGVSGVIGSAVFNIMFVISVCALCSGTVSQLNWWPLVRDCFFYSISILIMLFTIFDDVINWFESLVMLLMYVVYCVALHFNSGLEKWAHNLNLPIKLPTKEEQSALVTYKNLPEEQQKTSYTSPDSKQAKQITEIEQGHNISGGGNVNQGWDPNMDWDPNRAWGETEQANSTGLNDTSSSCNYQQPASNQGWDSNQSWGVTQQAPVDTTNTQKQVEVKQAGVNRAITTPTSQTVIENPGYYRPKEPRPQEQTDPLVKPTEGGLPAQISWAIVYPIHYMCRLTMPDCKTEKYRNWYPFTFFMSMIWISFYSYFMVWMITIIGSTLGIPDTVMGLTFVAAGVSVPDALSSIAVIKEGYGDMAVSNAVGSNVFDILICLGLPWFIQTAIIKPGSHVNVISKGLTYSTLSLLSTVLFLLISTHLNGWKLDRRLGVILMMWYLLFITVASLYELNVFGQLNPPECPSLF